MNKTLFLILISTFTCFFLTLTNAQEYPYEDPTKEDAGPKLPKESPDEVESSGAQAIRKKLSRHTWAFKVGMNYTIIQTPSLVYANDTITTRGMGFDGLFSFGSDLAYQPIFLEFESGYRGVLLSENNSKVHIIPLHFGAFYRQRIGEVSTWKPGLIGGLDFRIAKDLVENKYDWAVVPAFGISSLWELGHLLIEAAFTVHRIETQYNFFDFSLLCGYRF